MGFMLGRALKKDSYFQHNQDYFHACNRIQVHWSNQHFLYDLNQQMIDCLKPINCIKYNYNLDKNVQNFDSQDAHIEVSKDGSFLIIKNIKIAENSDYILEADPEET